MSGVDPDTLAKAIALALQQVGGEGVADPQPQPEPLPSPSVGDSGTSTLGSKSPLLLPPSADPQERAGQIHEKLAAMKSSGSAAPREIPPLVSVGREVVEYLGDWLAEIDHTTPAGKATAASINGILTRLMSALKNWNSDHAKIQVRDNSGWESHARTLLRLLGMKEVQEAMTQHVSPSVCAAVSEASAMLMVRLDS